MKVKLTESKLKQIVAESVKKVLNNVINEGKTINNKPYFKGHFNTLVNPGEMSYGKVYEYSSDIGGFWAEKGYENASDAQNAVKEGKLDKKTYLEWVYEYREIYDNYISQRNKHNERADSKYKDGKPTFGEEWFNKQYKKSKKTEKDNNRDFLKMLKANNISKEEFKELPPEKKRDCWDNYYYDYGIPEEPVGYWDNLLDNARDAGRLY